MDAGSEPEGGGGARRRGRRARARRTGDHAPAPRSAASPAGSEATYSITESAARDLAEILAWVEEDRGLPVAQRLLRDLERGFEVLARFPRIGRSHVRFASGSTRFVPWKAWLVFYDPTAAPVAILRVIHAARDLDALPEEQRGGQLGA